MNSLKYHKAIFFDFDGVIINTEALYYKLMGKYNKKYNIVISKDYYINNFLGKSKTEISKKLEKLYKDFDSEQYWKGLLKFRDNYINNHIVSTKKGLKKLLNYLKSNNYLIGIVSSNSLDFIQKMLIKNNIDIKLFDIIVTRENVKNIKPYPDLYEYAIAEAKLKANINRDEIIAIEDSEVGLQSAHKSNLKVIHLKDISTVSDEILSKCILSVTSLIEVIRFLKKNGGKNGNNKDKEE